MLATLVKKEIQQNLYGFKFQAILLLMLVLVFSSTYVMYFDYNQRVKQYEIMLPDLAKQKSMLRPNPLAIYAKGMDEALCSICTMSPYWGINSVTQHKENENGVCRLFRAPDLFYVSLIVFSLCAILFSCNLVTAEKEDGTLRQMLAGSLNRSQLLAGKWVGGFICLALPFTVAFLLSLAVVSLLPQVGLNLQSYLRLALIFVGTLLYLAFFFSLGLLVSTACRRSSVSLSLTLLLWVGLVFILPRLGSAAAERIVAVPSAQRFALQKKIAVSMNYRNWDRSRQGREGEYNWKTLDPNHNRLVADYRNRLGRLVHLTEALNRLSPAGVYSMLTLGLAGTGVQERLNLKRAYLDYWDIFLDLPRDEDGELTHDSPGFIYHPLSLSQVLAHGGLLNLTLLLLQSAAAFAASWILFLRYDAR